MTLKLRLLLIVPGLLFLVALTAFEFGLRKGRASAPARSMTTPDEVLTDRDLVKTLYAQDLQDRRFLLGDLMPPATGHEVIPFDRGVTGSQETIAVVAQSAERALLTHNSSTSPVRGLSRINEASRFFEDTLQELIDAHPDFSCSIPKTNEGQEQRSGYPDLRLEHRPTGTVTYLDPKLFAEDSRDSSLRTFYFQPREGSSKVTEDARHLLLGISHDGKDGEWTFLEWELIDLASLQVRLKAEFQASNRDLYRDAARVASSSDAL